MRLTLLRTCFSFLIPMILGLTLVLSALNGLALAEGGDSPSALPEATPTADDPSPWPSFYARVVVSEALVYADPADAEAGHPPVRSLGTGYLWVSMESPQPISANNQKWYRINEDEYVQMEHLSVYTPSTFRGITITTQPAQPLAWLVYYVQPSITPGIVTTETAWLKRYDIVPLLASKQVTEGLWYQVGPEQWVYQTNLAIIKPMTRPSQIGPEEKWIDVNLFEQTAVAYEGDRMVYATLVSSGLPRWPTRQGLMRLWGKVVAGKMEGGEPGDDFYFLEDVPWTMYFKGAYALHGAYWHDSFGFPHSHGCVNMSMADAKWLYDWVTPVTGPNDWTMASEEDQGTWVLVHDGTGEVERQLMLEWEMVMKLRNGR